MKALRNIGILTLSTTILGSSPVFAVQIHGTDDQGNSYDKDGKVITIRAHEKKDDVQTNTITPQPLPVSTPVLEELKSDLQIPQILDLNPMTAKEIITPSVTLQPETKEEKNISIPIQNVNNPVNAETKNDTPLQNTHPMAPQVIQEEEKKVPQQTQGISLQNIEKQEETLIFGRTPERIEHNINKEISRGVEGFTNFLTHGKWKSDKKLKKKKN